MPRPNRSPPTTIGIPFANDRTPNIWPYFGRNIRFMPKREPTDPPFKGLTLTSKGDTLPQAALVLNPTPYIPYQHDVVPGLGSIQSVNSITIDALLDAITQSGHTTEAEEEEEGVQRGEEDGEGEEEEAEAEAEERGEGAEEEGQAGEESSINKRKREEDAADIARNQRIHVPTPTPAFATGYYVPPPPALTFDSTPVFDAPDALEPAPSEQITRTLSEEQVDFSEYLVTPTVGQTEGGGVREEGEFVVFDQIFERGTFWEQVGELEKPDEEAWM